ncbi:hypothetical protein TNCV_4258411 [Trichonephila clavipes]|nr:hypothetical protein TNCV_4258411 [Trichonephila clavipes]
MSLDHGSLSDHQSHIERVLMETDISSETLEEKWSLLIGWKNGAICHLELSNQVIAVVVNPPEYVGHDQ